MPDTGLGVKFQWAIVGGFPRANFDNKNSPIAELRAENPRASLEINQTNAESLSIEWQNNLSDYSDTIHKS